MNLASSSSSWRLQSLFSLGLSAVLSLATQSPTEMEWMPGNCIVDFKTNPKQMIHLHDFT